MHIVFILALTIALVVGLVLAVMLPRPWQRAVVLLLVGFAVFLIAQSVTSMARKEVAIRNHRSNIRPTGELWEIVKRDVDSGQYEQAKARLVLITENWEKVGPMSHSYTARDLLSEIEAAHEDISPNPHPCP
jgi:hypothetical protein